MPQTPDEINIVIKKATGAKIATACKLMAKLDGRPCHRYYAVDRAVALLIKKLRDKLSREGKQ